MASVRGSYRSFMEGAVTVTRGHQSPMLAVDGSVTFATKSFHFWRDERINDGVCSG